MYAPISLFQNESYQQSAKKNESGVCQQSSEKMENNGKHKGQY